MQIELNIGLERKDGVLPVATYRQALATLRTAVTLTMDRTFQSSYTSLKGAVVEELNLYVAFEWRATHDELKTFIGLLAVDLGQDSIAVHAPSLGSIVLVGPKAAELEAKCRPFFRRCDIWEGKPI